MSHTLSGPSGGMGGHPFDDEPFSENIRIREVRVWAGNYVDAIQLVVDIDGEAIEQPKRGGDDGDLGILKLGDTEYVTEISGRYSSYIVSLSIRTNRGQTRRFGGQSGGNEFIYAAPDDHHIVGIWGRAERLLDSVGVYFTKLP